MSKEYCIEYLQKYKMELTLKCNDIYEWENKKEYHKQYIAITKVIKILKGE